MSTWSTIVDVWQRLLKAVPLIIPEQQPLEIDRDGWLHGEGVTVISAHPSWHGGTLIGNAPGGVVAHVSDTKPGTANNMAKRRARRFGEDPNDRMASWHASVETDGSLVQMVSLQKQAWHAGSNTAREIPGLGWANRHTVGLELIGFEQGPFPEAQVYAYARLLRAIVRRYSVPREFAMVSHQSIDPKRRSDPGKEWMQRHAERALEYTYRSQ